jgi:hypothetical protein
MAEELSRLTGERMTTTVTIALRERLLALIKNRASASPIDFWQSAARKIHRLTVAVQRRGFHAHRHQTGGH